MIPDLILDNFYAFNEEHVYDRIQKAGLNGSISGRMSGVRLKKTDRGKELLTWQCNLASMQNIDVKLPTIMHIVVDNANIIQSISLNEQFKGSQGITCSWKYLNRHMQNTLLASGFSPRNPLISNPLTLCCRHIYELTLGACTFSAYCENRGVDNAYLSASTMAYENRNTDMIESVDRICVNGKDIISKVCVSNYLNSITYDNAGVVCACDDLRISGYNYHNNKYTCICPEITINADNSNDFRMKVMKALSSGWLDCGKRLGIRKDFYFSHIWPPTAYGLLVQLLSLSMHRDNDSHFRQCVSEIQRVEGKPLCIGVINSIEEGERVFNGFLEGDLT
jgi:hypothetical protein